MLIYIIKNTIDGKLYVGKTTKSLETRWSQHKKSLVSNSHINKHLQFAWNKYGADKFIIEQIKTCNTLDELNQSEKYYINQFNTIDKSCGYNMSAGGDGGKLTSEVYEKLSNKLKGRKLSDSHKKNISLSLKGREIKWKDKLSLANKGKKPSEQAILRSKELFTGMKLSEEVRKKISESVKRSYKQTPIEIRSERYKRASETQRGKLAGGITAYNKATETKRQKKENRVNKDLLFKYIEQGLTIDEISTMFNVGTSTISRMCHHYWNKSIKQLRKDM